MKKVVLLSLFTLCFPILLSAQNYDDDLYYVPDKNKETGKVSTKKEVTKTTTVYTMPETTVVVRDRKTKKVRDVDEYNRRYDSSDYKFESDGDTLYVEEKSVSDLDGEWVNGFDGSQDDYEYAERIIRFRNPRYAIHISSPLYWDVVYGGFNSWNWNVYTDGWYAYAFPTFSNRLWWDWRYNSFGWGWGGGYYGSYYSWGYPSYWGGGYWGNYYPYYNSYYPHYYGGWNHGHSGYWTGNVYQNDRRSVYSSNRINTDPSVSSRRSTTYSGSSIRRNESGASTRQQNYTPNTQTRRSSSSARVVGTRRDAVDAVNGRQSTTTRPSASSTRTTTYTRPSSTRSTSTVESNRSINTSNEGTYTRGSSTTSSRRSSSEDSSNSSYNNNSNSSRQSSSPSSSSSSRSSSYSSGSSSSSSSSSRSSSGGSSGSSSRR
ncbi:MAG: hypothetical protein LBV64_06850 [Mediterranea sp.]|nr:hypothetical protein [Mediterranea sp.]